MGNAIFLDPRTGRGPFVRTHSNSPNILLISLDMVPPAFYRREQAAVGEQTRTPRLDALRREGWFFNNAFATSPLCTPSRASYLTGRYSYITGNEERGHDGHTFHLRPDDPIFPEYLKSVGYHTRQIGKCHVGRQRFIEVFGENTSPWDRWSPPWYDDEAYLRFLKAQGLRPFDFEREIYGLDSSGTGQGNFYGGWIAPQEDRPFPKQAVYPAFLAEQALSVLELRPAGKPFYLQLDFFGPHQPFAVPSGMEDREREIRDQLTLPESFRRLQENRFQAPWPEPRVYRLYRKNWGLQDPRTALDYRVANQLQYELLDEQIGRVLDGLREQGCYEDTWIFVLADHGEMNAEMALLDKGAFLNPLALRVPLIIRPPAAVKTTRDKEFGEPVSLLDLAPTILDIAGIRIEDRLDGISLASADDNPGGKSERIDRLAPQKKPILFEIWNHVLPNPAVGMVFQGSDHGLYSFVYNASDDQDELYRLDSGDEFLNRIDELSTVRREAIQTMASALAADARWFAYAQYFNLEYAESLPEGRGDAQLFQGR